MNDIRFDCPTCSQSLEASEEFANQLIDCPTCNATIQIPIHSRQQSPEIVSQLPSSSAMSPVGQSSELSVQPASKTPGPSQAIGLCFYGLALVLFLIGLAFLGYTHEERFENRMLSLAYERHSAAIGSYESTAQLYFLGSTSRGSVDRADVRVKEASEEIDKRKQRLSEMAAGRRFKMCLFFAGAAVFFIGGVIRSS